MLGGWGIDCDFQAAFVRRRLEPAPRTTRVRELPPKRSGPLEFDMTLIAVLVAVGTLVLLIAVVKLHPFVAFLIAAIVAALLLGRPVGILRS